MRGKYLFIAAGIMFLAVAVFELLRTHTHTAPTLDAVAGAIFLFLGFTSRARRQP